MTRLDTTLITASERPVIEGQVVGFSMWLLGRLVPDHKTVADFRKDNGRAIRQVCARFVELCGEVGLLANASVAIDGSKFKAVNRGTDQTGHGRLAPQRRRASVCPGAGGTRLRAGESAAGARAPGVAAASRGAKPRYGSARAHAGAGGRARAQIPRNRDGETVASQDAGARLRQPYAGLDP